ncbi:MAG: hypothetical protein R2911_31345 [Caldilineaceae bacterium]
MQPGQQVTLSWDLSKAYNGAFLREIALDGTMGPEQGVVAPGSLVVSPPKTINYDLIARNEQGESMRRLTIMVAAADATATPLPGADQLPLISYFRADRYEITAGEQAILSWDLSGAESAFLLTNGAEEGVTAPSAPFLQADHGLSTGGERNAAGESAQEVTVVVKEAAETQPTTELTPTNTPEGQDATPVPAEATPTAEPPAAEPTPTAEPAAEVEPAPTEAAAEEALEAARLPPWPPTTPSFSQRPTVHPRRSASQARRPARWRCWSHSEDSAWLQVTLEDGSTGWVATDQVDVTVDVATLPVMTTP